MVVDIFLAARQYYTLKDDIYKENPEEKKNFVRVLFGIKLLMGIGPIPFLALTTGWAKDTFVNRRLCYRVIWSYIMPVEIITIILLIVAICMNWIRSANFWRYFIGETLFFIIYLYFMAILARYARMKKQEEDE